MINLISIGIHFNYLRVESLNRATHNSPVRLKNVTIDGKIFPKVTFTQINDTENFDVIESCLREVLKSQLVLPTLDGAVVKELLLQLIQVLNSYFVQLPLRRQHQLTERVDMSILKTTSNIFK